MKSSSIAVSYPSFLIGNGSNGTTSERTLGTAAGVVNQADPPKQAVNAQSLRESSARNAKAGSTDGLPEGMLMRQTVPSDNSCLFTSVYYCISGGELDHKVAPTLRSVIADHVRKDEATYNEGF